MNHYSFVVVDNQDIDLLNDLEARFDLQETVSLESETELKTLLSFFSTSTSNKKLPEISDVVNSWFLSNIPQYMDENAFEEFYPKWLSISGRENTMDEYGQLLYLNSFFKKYAASNSMVVLHEEI